MRERKKRRKTLPIVADNSKLAKDWSAEERFVNRSIKIRKRVKQWMLDNKGEVFETSSVMSDMCANDCSCSTITAYRWLHQWSAPNTALIITEQPAGLVIMDRIEEGIKEPERKK